MRSGARPMMAQGYHGQANAVGLTVEMGVRILPTAIVAFSDMHYRNSPLML